MRTTIALLAAVALIGVPSGAATRGHVGGHSERLAARARRGDHVARTKLVEEHMGLVRSIAFRYRDLGLPTEDLVQEGAIGLLTAIDDYDASRGASFSTYAFWRVRAAITHALTAHGRLVRIPRPVLERRRELAQARERLATEGREPTVQQLAEATGLPARDVVEALRPVAQASLDQPATDGTTLGESVATDAATWPDAQLVELEQAKALRGALLHLQARKRTILGRHFGLSGEPQTLTRIADDLHLSPERTRALRDEALRELASELEPAVGA
jgi:RNA polymerase primary sigma factor